MEPKRIYRSRTDCKIAGVCGGIANYLNVDPTLIRLIWVALVLFGGSGLLAYLICALVIPEEPWVDPAQ
ncbi:MAG: PspC domain-containing protein [Clostridia bacterium]|nr:PspC domain-containing protein [Clostridia bacterium]